MRSSSTLAPHADLTPLQPTLEERFWSKVEVRGPEDCWEWRGYRDFDGYRTHRVSWEIHFGSVPNGMLVCHYCDNPPCCNPAHLFLGDDANNAADRTAKGRTYSGPMNQGAANGRARLTPQLVAEIRARYGRGGVSQAALARVYGVGPQHISKIVRRVRWA